MAQSQTIDQREMLNQRLAMETRSKELAENMRQHREGLHVEQAPDLLDSLQLAAERDFEVERLTRDRQELSLVQRALHNLEAGVYGECTECGEQIPAKRLKVMPWAVRCVPCQEQFETLQKEQPGVDSWQFQTA